MKRTTLEFSENSLLGRTVEIRCFKGALPSKTSMKQSTHPSESIEINVGRARPTLDLCRDGEGDDIDLISHFTSEPIAKSIRALLYNQPIIEETHAVVAVVLKTTQHQHKVFCAMTTWQRCICVLHPATHDATQQRRRQMTTDLDVGMIRLCR